MTLAAAVLAVALAADVVDVERATVTTDAGVLELRGGCWLSDGVCLGTAQELVKLRTENAELRKGPPVGTIAAVAAVTLVCGLVLGGLAVWQLKK